LLKSPIKAVLFDCDGTLVDDLKDHHRIWPKIFREFKLGRFNTRAGRSVGNFLKRSGLSNVEIRKFWKRFNSLEFDMAPKAFRGVNRLLRILKKKGILVAIVTNRPTVFNYLSFLIQAGLDISLVDYFVNHDSTPSLVKLCPNQFSASVGKPHPEILTPIIKFLKKLPGFPEAVLMVGDSWADLHFAQNCNFQFAGVTSGSVKTLKGWKAFGFRNQGVIVKEVSELIKLFK